MPSQTTSQDSALDEVAIQQMIWKNTRLLSACLIIAKHAVDHSQFWPDELTVDFLLGDDDRNIIGSAWRLCANKLKIIRKTGQYKRSAAKDSNGRIIFEYVLTDAKIARAFVTRHGGTVPTESKQLALL